MSEYVKRQAINDLQSRMDAAEAILDPKPNSFTFTPAAGAANVCEVTIQAKSASGSNMARPVNFLLYLSDAADGEGLTGTSASGAVAVKASSGTDFAALTAKKAILAQTKDDGTYILSITDTAKTGFRVCADPLTGVAVSVSDALETADYGT